MTAEAAVLNKSGVALAADSKATLRIKGTPKSHDAANKLFTLSKYHPVGIMINGNAEFMSMPWETIIKVYRDALREKCLPKLENYAEDFVFSLTEDYKHDDDSQNENVFFIIADLLSSISDWADVFEKRKDSRKDALTKSIEFVSRRDLRGDNLPSLEGLSPDTIRESYEKSINTAIDFVFDDLGAELREALITYASNVLLKPVFSDGQSEVIVAGFGDSEIFPSLQSWIVDGVVAGKLRCKIGEQTRIARNGQSAAIHPFAQREMVDRFMLGIDPDYRNYLNTSFAKILRSTSAQLIEKYGKGRKKEKAHALVEIQKNIDSALTDHRKIMDDYAFKTYAQPIIDMTEQLPKDELAHLAESLVNLTSFKRRVSLDAESVGGAIDVAVISKGDGFVWIKRKHYFELEKNGTFLERYFRRYMNSAGETAHDRKRNNP